MVGERIFARAAYGVPLLGRQAEAKLSGMRMEVGLGRRRCVVDYDTLTRLAIHVEDWLERFTKAVAAFGYPVVGCTTVFEQTASSIAILRRIKHLVPETTTIIGGANCASGMAEGVVALTSAIDFAFSGECERAFPAFLAGSRPSGRIVEGELCMDLDNVPTPDYEHYYRQRRLCLEDDPASLDLVYLPYESSRGCWWGQKHHCTFCGISEMRHREKSPDRVVEELNVLLDKHPSRRVFNVDNIMPYSYFKSVLPRLAKAVPGVKMFYEEKANVTLDKVQTLRDAGIQTIQAGIEALSTPLLRRMDKGVLARQNVALLRYTRAARITVIWMLIFGFPGDRPEDYADYPTLLPLLHHLEPPRGLTPLQLVRFSPYWKDPERYGIRDLRAAEVYADILPETADAGRIAYYHDGEFPSVATEHPEIIAAIDRCVRAWTAKWLPGTQRLPDLSLRRAGPDGFILKDTRGLAGAPEVQLLSRRQAAAVLVGRPLESPGELGEDVAWARECKYAVELDGWHVPLATAELGLLAELEQEYGLRAETRLKHESEGEQDRLISTESLRRSGPRRTSLPVR